MTAALQQPHPGWQNLLDWLATHGMDTSPSAMSVQARATPGTGYGLFALRDTDQASRLFSIPSSALLNLATLSSSYPRARQNLTAIQLMSLHLFLFRPVGLQPSCDPLFGPYVSILPHDFASHPLTWLCSEESNKYAAYLLSNLPSGIVFGLSEVAKRYYADWAIVRQYIHNDFPPSIAEVIQSTIQKLHFDPSKCNDDFLWAWLNVNTRCLYHRLEQSSSNKNNVTMCPVIDFANHTPHANHMSPQPLSGHKAKVVPPKTLGHDFGVLSPSSVATKLGDELFLTYGAHSNRTLFVEYGFVNEVSEEVLSRGDVGGEIDVQCIVAALFEAKGEFGAWMKSVLQEEGYWGEWTLDDRPSPAHPSFRLITALRLLHLFPASEKNVPLDPVAVLKPWRATIMGVSDTVSEQNEEVWKDSLLRICRGLSSNAQHAITSLDGEPDLDGPPWMSWMKQTIRMLWVEELYVSTMVAHSIIQKEEF